MTAWKSGTGMVNSLGRCWVRVCRLHLIGGVCVGVESDSIEIDEPSHHDVTAHERQTREGLLPGSESNRVVKEQRLLTRESESSKGLLPGCKANLHGCFRTPTATRSELKVAIGDPDRRKPLEKRPLTRKAESVGPRLRALTG